MNPTQVARGLAWLAAGVFTVALGLTVWWPGDDAPSPGDGPASAATTRGAGPAPAPLGAAAPAVGPASAPVAAAEPPPLADTTALPRFAADARGHLRLDPATRTGVERIAALWGPPQALAVLDRQSADLPVQARRELTDLYHRHVQYAQAVAQALPPQADTAPEQAWAQFEMLRSLRRQHFGDEAARALFGAEEQMTAALLQQAGLAPRP